ncbi:MAG: LacI family DNA-binding transcriptional regulator [Ignavibacteriaceae bacterium]|nr:LacI family DNA-binding transcriptional regulator [Ignavibacteriaceae bacterium]
MPYTLKDIAEKTGVSVSTVSRVLHDNSQKYKISEDTQAKVKAVAKSFGYRVNALARGLRTQKTNEIGVIVPDISNPFFSAVIKSVAGELRKKNYNFIVYDSDEDISIERSAIKSLLEKHVDGLVIASVGQDFSHIQKIREANIPFVMVDRCFDDFDADSVSVDNVKGALLAVNHLIKSGHRRIAFIQGLPGTYANETRLEGYKSALTSAGISIDENLIVGDDFRSLNGYLETKLLLKLSNPPTAIFTAGDLIALGALEACRENNISIPDDLSLITFDDPVFTTYLSPPLSAVEQPISKIAEMAIAMLYRRMKNPNDERRKVLLEPKLNVRGSVANISTLAFIPITNNNQTGKEQINKSGSA